MLNDNITLYLGGTCNGSSWRDTLKQKLNENIMTFDPTVDHFSIEHERQVQPIKRICNYMLYVITSEMKGYIAIANAVDYSNKYPERLLFCVMDEGFDDYQLKAIQVVKNIVENNGAKVFDTLEEVSDFLNNLDRSKDGK